MSSVSSVSNANHGACCDCKTRPDDVIGLIFLHLCRENIPEKYAFYYPHFQDLCRKSENNPAELHDSTSLVVGGRTQSSITQQSPKGRIATEFDFEQFCSSRDDHIREWISEHHQESASDFQPMLSARASLAILIESVFCSNTKDEKDKDDKNVKMQFRKRVQNCNSVVDIQLVKHPNWSLRDTPGVAEPQLEQFVRFILDDCFHISTTTPTPKSTPLSNTNKRRCL